ncbi:MAG: hypothetical protein KGR26_13710 [Cyanobacteria bacterium REEB65]|nr:hypothetical protein [Cyanobacteria bacterium REEB65]
MIRVWIERQDCSTFCGVVQLADGSILLWTVEVTPGARSISYAAGSRLPFAGSWVRHTTDAICHAIDKVIAGCQQRQFTLFA